MQDTNNGRLIIQAGLLPDVGAPEQGHPPAYVAVNRVLKSVRVPHPDQLHTSMDDAEGFTKANTLAWYARFDEPEVAATLHDIPAQILRCDGGEICPQSGTWWTSAKPDACGAFA